ncbi:MAG: GNAT family N-acetyltransferase [Burkholderiales bacterium]|nr:GNAT family N-acetyltransferase [Burkholderiales bacterium]
MQIHYRRATEGDALAVARVHCDSWRSTYPGLVAAHVIDAWTDVERRYVGWSRIIAERPETLWLAVTNNEVVGFADGGAARDRNDGFAGQLYSIYLIAEAQRRGIGEGLVALVFDDLNRAGLRSARVEVLKGNQPAICFYKKLGASLVREAPHDITGEPMTELVYGWRSLPSLGDLRGAKSLAA